MAEGLDGPDQADTKLSTDMKELLTVQWKHDPGHATGVLKGAMATVTCGKKWSLLPTKKRKKLSRWIRFAAKGGWLAAVVMLMRAGVDPINRQGKQSALRTATKQGHLNVVQRILGAFIIGGPKDIRKLELLEKPLGRCMNVAAKRGFYTLVYLFVGIKVRLLNGKLRQIPHEKTWQEFNFGNGHAHPLHLAAENGHLEVVNFFIEHGRDDANVHKERANHGSPKWTPLMSASKGGQLSIIEYLIGKGADVNAGDATFKSALMYAVKNQDQSVIECLINAGANVNQTAAVGRVCPLMLSLPYTNRANDGAVVFMARSLHTVLIDEELYYRAAIIELLLCSGADESCLVDKKRQVMLGVALRAGNMWLINHIMQRGILPIVCGTPILSFVMEASHLQTAERVEILETLCEAGVDVGKKHQEEEYCPQRYPILTVAEKYCTDILTVLIKYGALLDVANNKGQTALMLTAVRDRSDVLGVLLDAGVNTDARDHAGRTALMHAVANAQPCCTQMLLTVGADVNVTDADGNTALLIAVMNHKDNCSTYKRSHADDDDDAAVTKRCISSHTSDNLHSIEMLLKAGANPNVDNIFGFTPLIAAIQNGNQHLIDMLLEAKANPNKASSRFGSALAAAVCSDISTDDNPSLVDKLLHAKADPNVCPGERSVPLVDAAKRGFTNICRSLLSAGACVNVLDKSADTTPLIAAVDGQHMDTISCLLQAGADVNLRDHKQHSALFCAIHGMHGNNNLAVLEVILASNPCQNEIAKGVVEAVRTGNVMLVEALWSRCTNPDSRPDHGQNALCTAAVCGYHDVIKFLLATNAFDVDSCDLHGNTPLVHAIIGGYTDVASILIEAGASCSSTMRDGKNLLHVACEKGCLDITRLLLEKGVNVSLEDKFQRTPLFYGVVSRSVEVVDLLVEAGCSVNVIDRRGHTPLMMAVETEDVRMVEVLLKSGADCNIISGSSRRAQCYVIVNDVPNSCGKTPLLDAVLRQNVEITKLLIIAGAHVNVTFQSFTAMMNVVRNGCFPCGANHFLAHMKSGCLLTVAVCSGRKDLVQLLVNAGANLDHQDSSRQTPALVAAVGSQWEILDILLEAGANVNQADICGNSLIKRACLEKRTDLIQTLIYKGADVGDSGREIVAVFMSKDNGIQEVLFALLQEKELKLSVGMDVLEEVISSHQISKLQKLLRITCQATSNQVYAGLLSHAVNAVLQHKSLEAVEELLKNKELLSIDMNEAVEDGTPLMQACTYANNPLIKMLLMHGGDAEGEEDCSCMYVLLEAIRDGEDMYGVSYTRCVQTFLVWGVDLNNPKNWSFEWYDALDTGFSAIMEMLLVAGYPMQYDQIAKVKELVDDRGDFDDVQSMYKRMCKMAAQPERLKFICRITVRKCLKTRIPTKVCHLELPRDLEEYLLLPELNPIITTLARQLEKERRLDMQESDNNSDND